MWNSLYALDLDTSFGITSNAKLHGMVCDRTNFIYLFSIHMHGFIEIDKYQDAKSNTQYIQEIL